MLPDAFTPPDGLDSDDNAYEEQIYTTPLQLLQVVELWLRRMEGGDAEAAAATELPGLLPGAAMGLDAFQLQQLLLELREDIMAAWDAPSEEEF